AECGFVYRGSALPASEVVVAARLLLPQRPQEEIAQAVAALRTRRKEREPHGVGCAGSFFKNPPGDYAGRLIEACGLKGTRRGDAEISTVHANWFVNVGSARAADLVSLIELSRSHVEQRFGITLDLEVKILGEPA
ncbi:MAG TPA: UDP-N-acetylenolpyruvoylglucosamine reductase, partial [Pseudomonadota bacterium]|nr:UDP-N-acetylenolpyruvoylglucosamine reductase [Pseudomonadota bacterium]